MNNLTIFYISLSILVIGLSLGLGLGLGLNKRKNHQHEINNSRYVKDTTSVHLANQKDIGFIILRHVNSFESDVAWVNAYRSIRKFYPELDIVILDDNSKEYYLNKNIELYKTTVIQNEYPKRGELIPYIYYYKNKYFDTAVIIHDSVVINSYIDFTVDKYRFIWDFGEGDSEDYRKELSLIKLFNNNKLEEYFKEKKWKGCFGVMTIIKHDFLTELYNEFNLDILISSVKTKLDRMCIERVLAVMLQYLHKNYNSLYGNIHKYQKWGINQREIKEYDHLPIIKTWFGR